ncbi:hypothetical protein [Xanthobacter autotrophicus]|uniref:hypothetical protein n=1 Tax=Xanthobacter autotrophicus TaxID=280 RepID=UPI0037265D94
MARSEMIAMLMHARRPGRAQAVAAVLAVLLGTAAPAFGEQGAAPEARVIRDLNLKGDLGTGKEKRSLSGIACATPPGPGPRACILVGDENDLMWSATLAGKAIRLDARIHAAQAGAAELDLEGATFAAAPEGGAYYITGSHGASRTEGKYEAGRFLVFRIPTDPATGAIIPGGITATRTLESVIAALPDLARLACREGMTCERLDAEGLNIEGIAARDGALYFGLRNPTKAGATILKVPAGVLFAGPAPKAEVLRVQLDAGNGVRDLAPVAGGFLILAGLGRSDDQLTAKRSVIHFWDGQSETAMPLAQITSADGKPEALLVITDSVAGRPYEVLLLMDGAKDGAPAVYEVPAR